MKIRLPKENKHLGDDDKFGQTAEAFAIFFGTPTFLVLQTVITVVWIVFNSIVLFGHWDPKPFLLLNFLYTIQSGYAAPLILLAQTRQAARDKIQAEIEEYNREEIANETIAKLQYIEDLIKKDVHESP